jgi:hypothetical protein
LRRTPEEGEMKYEPKAPFTVVVVETALPKESTTAI